MPANIPKILLLAIMLVTDAALFTPTMEAKATRAKPASVAAPASHKKDRKARVESAERSKTSSKSSRVQAHSREVISRGSTREVAASKHVSPRRMELIRVSSHPIASRSISDRPSLHSLRSSHPTRKVVHEPVRRQPAPILRAEAASEPAPTPLPDIHVTHDRKQHHSIPGETSSPASHGKATSEDFLTPSGPTAGRTGVSRPDTDNETSPRSQTGSTSINGPLARNSGARPTLSAAQSVSVVNVVRATESRPQLVPIDEQALEPILLPTLYNKRGRLIMPPPLKGSHEILVHQNEVADREGLDRIRDDEDLRRLRESHMLVSVSESSAIVWDDRLPSDRRYVRPWTAQFLTAMSRAHYARFHSPLQINSGVRTVEFQQHLLRVNGNAAPAAGDTASPHLTGQAVDLAKHGLSMVEIAWMRAYLLPLVQQGKVDVEEEFQQSCFHISVYKTYVPFGPAPHTIQTNHRGMALAAAME